MVSIGILLIIIATVVIRFISFDSTVLLKSLTYDIAFSIREAQAYSLSVLGADTGFRDTYGVSFTKDDDQYVLFTYEIFEESIPVYTAGNEVTLYKLGRAYKIEEVCVTVGGESQNCSDVDRVDISFRRPEYRALFYTTHPQGDVFNEKIESATIKVSTDDGSTRRGVVTIGYAGQITVALEE